MDILNGDPETIKKVREILFQAAAFHRNYVIQQMNRCRKKAIDVPITYIGNILTQTFQSCTIF